MIHTTRRNDQRSPTKDHIIRVHPSTAQLPKEEQLAWRIATAATDRAPIDASAIDMVVNRIIDNAAVATAALNRGSVVAARNQARAHHRAKGATVFGLSQWDTVHAEWAAWANGVAVRELDFHDTFLAADYAHPGDTIPPILAVAQQCACTGEDVVHAILTAYEVQIVLVKGICLHEHKKDHVAHLAAAQSAGIGALLRLDTGTVYQAVQLAVHVSFATRQSRKGDISSWKAYAPAHVGKLAVECVNRAMRGEGSPSPIYEGEDSVLAYMLDGSESSYTVSLPELGESKCGILESYTKEYSAEYQAQALIDLACRMHDKVSDIAAIASVVIHTSHHTHNVIGTGANDPKKLDPDASRETLDHSIMYIFAVALQDGGWNHAESYVWERTQRSDTIALWNKITTKEDAEWTRQYHSADPAKKAFGARV